MSRIRAPPEIRRLGASWHQCFLARFCFVFFFPPCAGTRTQGLAQIANLRVSCVFQPLISYKETSSLPM